MTNKNRIIIKNIYYMLSYAFRVLKQSTFQEVAGEEFVNIHNLYAAILSKGISQQLKHGLFREYITINDKLTVLKGKLELQGTIDQQINRKRRLSCDRDELSENNIYNQILKSTAYYLIRNQTIDQKWRQSLKRSLMYFSSVDCVNLSRVKWSRLSFQRHNRTYEMLMTICYFIVMGMLQTTELGTFQIPSFVTDHLASLFEKFVLEYYRYHYPFLKPTPKYIQWNVDLESDDNTIRFLPIMKTDVTLHDGNRHLIIDTKFYQRTMQNYFDTYKLHSHNLYQIYTYVKNMDREKAGKVAGMLLYAKTNEQLTPKAEISLDGHMFYVRTLDLNQPFTQIQRQLDDIINTYFGSNAFIKRK